MHRDSKDLLKLIKKISNDSVNASKPVNILFGTVVAISPLEIQIEQKLILQENQIVLTRNVTDYNVDMIVDHVTEKTSGGSGDSSFSSHNHAYTGTKKFTVLNGLQVGDTVVLARVQEGRRYLVLDRIGEVV